MVNGSDASYTIDVVKCMKEISFVMQTLGKVLEAQGVTPSDVDGIQHFPLCYVN